MTNKKPVEVVRDGAIAASVWERAGNRGRYFEFTLSRSFKPKGKDAFGYSGCYRERDAEALKRCIDRATEWIKEHEGVLEELERQAAACGAQAGPSGASGSKEADGDKEAGTHPVAR